MGKMNSVQVHSHASSSHKSAEHANLESHNHVEVIHGDAWRDWGNSVEDSEGSLYWFFAIVFEVATGSALGLDSINPCEIFGFIEAVVSGALSIKVSLQGSHLLLEVGLIFGLFPHLLHTDSSLSFHGVFIPLIEAFGGLSTDVSNDISGKVGASASAIVHNY